MFRLQDGKAVIEPGQLESFRLGLVNNRLPAIWGGWQHGGLLYKVSAMTVPSPQCGNFDLYKLEVQNPTAEPLPSKLFAAVDGPPDMHFEDGVVRGLGENVFLIADPPVGHKLETRDCGLVRQAGEGLMRGLEPAIRGRPSTAIASGSTACRSSIASRPSRRRNTSSVWPRRRTSAAIIWSSRSSSGDLVFEYRVEGCAPKTLDCVEWIAKNQRPLCVDSRTPATSTATAPSKSVRAWPPPRASGRRGSARSTSFPRGPRSTSRSRSPAARLNPKCIRQIDVGATPEQACRTSITTRATWA